MPLFKFKIFDIHELQYYNEDGELCVKSYDDKISWKRFNFCIDVTQVRLVGFRTYVLFDELEEQPIMCTKVFLDDGSFVFSTLKFKDFEQLYLAEYLPLITKGD